MNQIARLVRLTETHLPGPRDPEGELLCDADLAIPASDPADYAAMWPPYARSTRRCRRRNSWPDGWPC